MKRMDLKKLKIGNIARVAYVLSSEYRKKILEVLLNSKKPLNIIEIQFKCGIKNYKNAYDNVKVLKENNFVEVAIDEKKKHVEGARVTTSRQMVSEAISKPIRDELASVDEFFKEVIEESGREVLDTIEKTKEITKKLRGK